MNLSETRPTGEDLNPGNGRCPHLLRAPEHLGDRAGRLVPGRFCNELSCIHHGDHRGLDIPYLQPLCRDSDVFEERVIGVGETNNEYLPVNRNGRAYPRSAFVEEIRHFEESLHRGLGVPRELMRSGGSIGVVSNAFKVASCGCSQWRSSRDPAQMPVSFDFCPYCGKKMAEPDPGPVVPGKSRFEILRGK
jgi:hypothetical protein